ncbi:MAG: TMEM165/GDT1 family protein [Cellvibrionaceae bacterium]
MEALFFSTFAVAVAEVGDKTQLLSLCLAARFKRRWSIIVGIFLATLLNHALSAALGSWLVEVVPEGLAKWIIAGSFLAIALWVLIPDKLDDGQPGILDRYGPMLATTVLFFIAEIGDKTQVATIVLAAEYQNVMLVTMGTTLGMMMANVPVVIFGEKIMAQLPLDYARYGACILFLLLGALTLVLN